VHQRYRIRHTLHSSSTESGAKPTPHLIVVLGEAHSGKSHLVEWCADMCKWRGFTSAYVRFAGGDCVDLFGALRWIRDGLRHTPGQRPIAQPNWPLPAQDFRRFNWELNSQLRNEVARADIPEQPLEIADEGAVFNSIERPQEHVIANTLTQFRLALETVAQAAPLVLFLDHIEGIETTALTRWLPQQLWHPIAQGKVPRVRLVMAMREDDYNGRMKFMQDLNPPPTVVRLEYFKAEEFERLARYLCLQWSEKTYAFMRNVLPQFFEHQGKPAEWCGRVLEAIDHICRGVSL
jgi:hypothetical protein